MTAKSMFSISPYKLEMYLRCPRQYKFEYVDSLRKKYHRETPALIMGSIVHGTLNHYYRRVKLADRNFDKLREIFKEKFLDHHRRKDPKYAVFEGNQYKVNEWVKKTVKQLNNFYDNKMSRVEPYFAPETNPKYRIDDEIELTGRLDRVDKDEDGLVIIDYKTGRLWEQDIKTLQLDFYNLLLSYLYPKFKVSKKIYYYLTENKLVEVPIENNEVEKVLDLVVNTVGKIKKDKEFKACPNKDCRFCDYNKICDVWKITN